MICPINLNSHQISCILKVFYNDIVYFNVCTKIIYIYIYIMDMYVYCSYDESQNEYLNFVFKSESW
jgi:hypothetical protein